MTTAPTLPPACQTIPSGPFVLVVDDHDRSLQLLKAVIESAGLACLAAASGTDALVFCDTRAPQAVITDLAMPGLDGAVLAHWLRARYPHLPLVLVTGEDLDQDAVAHLRESFTAVLFKPIDPAGLLALIEALIRSAPPQASKGRGGEAAG